MQQKNKVCFILGSGQSLLKLTEEEIAYVNNSECVLAFNKYIIFDHLVGIKPTHYFLGDIGLKADFMFFETLQKTHSRKEFSLRFILDKSYRPGLSGSWKRQERLVKLNASEKKWLVNYYAIREFLMSLRMHRSSVYIERSGWLEGGEWANSFSEKLFHYRGSLSGAINIVNIMYPDYEIRLLGVDLDNHNYFFQQEIESNQEKWGVFLKRLTPESEQHETIVTYENKGGIQDMFPFIRKNVEKKGGCLYCSNPDSYLVKSGLLDYVPVISSSSR